MPENNFEEQARQAMEPFRVEPSAAVWSQLESRLKAARRKRRAFYLLTIIGLLAGLGILQWSRQHNASNETALASQMHSTQPAAADHEISPAKKSGNNSSLTENTSSSGSIPGSSPEQQGQQELAGLPAGAIAPSHGKQDQPQPAGTRVGAIASSAQKLPRTAGGPASAGSIVSPSSAGQQNSNETESASAEKPKDNLNGAMALRASALKNPGQPASENVVARALLSDAEISRGIERKDQAKRTADARETVVETDSETRTNALARPDPLVLTHPMPAASTKLTVPDIRMKPTTTDSMTAVRENITEKDTRSERFVEFGLSASAGRSAYTEGFAFVKLAAADQTVSQPGSFPQPQPIPYDYRHDPSIGFSAGVWMGFPVARRGNFRVGLQYQQFSTTSPVGVRVDSNRNFTGTQGTLDAQGYYRTGTGTSFTNRFHLVQLPLNLAWTLNPRASLPLSWSIGLSPGWLVSSNALVYDGNSALYHGKENQQDFQLGMQTGFQFHLLQKSARPLQLGPLFQYQFNRAFREGIQGNGHLYYLGLEASMPIFRKRMKQRSR